MAPKKKEAQEEKPILGRFSSHLKVRADYHSSALNWALAKSQQGRLSRSSK
jgi:hypothetical protein